MMQSNIFNGSSNIKSINTSIRKSHIIKKHVRCHQSNRFARVALVLVLLFGTTVTDATLDDQPKQQHQHQQPSSENTRNKNNSKNSVPPVYFLHPPHASTVTSEAAAAIVSFFQSLPIWIQTQQEKLLRTSKPIVQLLLYKPPFGAVVFYLTTKRIRSLLKNVLASSPRTMEEAMAMEEAEHKYTTNNRLPRNDTKAQPQAPPTLRNTSTPFSSSNNARRVRKAIKKKRKNSSSNNDWKKQRRSGRSLSLDDTDRTYDVHGGIEHVRVDLCVEALREVIKKRKNGIAVLNKNDADSEEMAAGYEVALEALLLRCPPRGSRAAFLERSAYPLSSLQRWYTQSINNAIDTDALLLWQASKLVEVRGIDVLLRVLRDDLVLNSARLERSVTNLKQRVQRHANRVYLVKVARDGYVTVVKALMQYVERLTVSIFRGFDNRNQKKKRGGIALWSALKGLVAATTATLEDDRRYLAIVEAGRDKEMESLGIVQMALFTRPKELSSSYLLTLADKKMKIDDDDTATISSEDGNTSKGSTAPDTAVRLLLLEGEFQEWSEDASQWTQESREIIYNISFLQL